jgi:hypothetical protein
MANQTIYDIRLRYLLDDKASKGLGKIGDDADRAARSTGALSGILGRIGTLVVGTFGARAAGKALIGFNSDLEQAKITMAGMIQLNMGGTWAKNMQTANSLVGDFQQMAKASVGTTKDFVDMAQLITRPITAAGGSMSDLKDATRGAVIAARAFNIDPEMASRDIEAALQGQLTAKDRFARALLEPMGYDTGKFNALDATKRLDLLIKAFNSPAIKDMAKAQENSFSGVVSTLQDNLQMTVGKIGLPLFKALTNEVKSWNTWLDQNQDKVKEIADSLAKGLVQGFGMVKDAISFLIEHKDTLLTLGKIWLAVRGAQAVGGLAGGAGGIGGMLGSKAFSKGAGGVGGTLGMVAGAGMAGWEIGKTLKTESSEFGDLLGALNDEWRENISMARKHREIQEEMDQLDHAIADARKRVSKWSGTMFGTEGAAQMQANAVKLKNELNMSGDRARQRGVQWSKSTKLIGAPGAMLAATLGFNTAGFNLANSAVGGNQAAMDRQRKQAEAADARAKVMPGLAQMVWTNALFQLNKTSLASLDQQRAQLEVMTMMQRTLSNTGLAAIPGMMQFLTGKANVLMAQSQLGGSDRERSKAKANKPNVNVTIQRIEVQSDDPDRLAFGLIESFRDAARNPSSAFSTLREG